MKLTNEFHDATTVEAMRKTLTHSTAKGIELKFYTIDGKVHIGKDILQLFSPVVRSMISADSMILVEPKEFVFIMKDVRTSCLKNLRSLLANGRINKLLTSSEIEEICVAGSMLGINLDNLSNYSADADATQAKLNLPGTFFKNTNIKKESLQDLPTPVPILEDDTKDSSVSEIIEQCEFELGEYICSPPSSPLRVKLRKVKNSNAVKAAKILEEDNLSVIAVETVTTPRSEIQESQSHQMEKFRKVMDSSPAKACSFPVVVPETETSSVAISTPRSDVQEPRSQPLAMLDDQMSVDSDYSENETENNNGVHIEKPMVRCGYCLFETNDPKVMKQHKKDIHNKKRIRGKKSKQTKTRSTGYFCNKCTFKTDQSSLAKQHSFDKHGHICSNICLRCGKRHNEQDQCKYLPDVRCTKCLKGGHVRSLHHPTSIKDYEVLKQFAIGMGIEIKKPSTSTPIGRGDKNMNSNVPRYSFQCETCPFKAYSQAQFRQHKCGEVIYNQRAPAPNVSGPRVQHSEHAGNAPAAAQGAPDEPTTLCLICGGHHGPKCNFNISTIQCAFRGCGQDGHIESLHYPKNYSDYKTIKSFMPQLLLSAVPQSQQPTNSS